jgi:competence protein ComEA
MIVRSLTIAFAWLLVAVAPGRGSGVSRPVPLPSHAQTQPAREATKVQLSEAEAAALPETEGRDAVVNMCVPCHGVLVVTTQRHTAAGWTAVLEDMQDKGAVGTDEQAAAAVAYLARHFPAVNVNTADGTELVRVLKIGSEEAEAIVAYRKLNPAFKTVDDLKRVPGLDSGKVDQQRAAITFSGK